MLLKPIKCPKCGAPIKGKERDLMLQCPSCGAIQFFDRAIKGTRSIEYRIVSPSGESKDPLVYIPFWVVHAQLNVRGEDISGGGIRRAVSGDHSIAGERDFYVCASDAVPEEVSRIWNLNMSVKQPQFAYQEDFRTARRLVMDMEEEPAVSAAEFLFLRYETELPGYLQNLDYDFQKMSASIIYLPAWKKVSGYTLAL